MDRVTFNAHIIETGIESFRLLTTTSNAARSSHHPPAPGHAAGPGRHVDHAPSTPPTKRAHRERRRYLRRSLRARCRPARHRRLARPGQRFLHRHRPGDRTRLGSYLIDCHDEEDTANAVTEAPIVLEQPSEAAELLHALASSDNIGAAPDQTNLSTAPPSTHSPYRRSQARPITCRRRIRPTRSSSMPRAQATRSAEPSEITLHAERINQTGSLPSLMREPATGRQSSIKAKSRQEMLAGMG
jgi:hypothetical protein